MIASLNGKIIYISDELKKDSYFIIEAGGVGYKVYSPLNNLKQVTKGDKIIVYTYLSVSERAMDLYGFLNPEDKTFFTLLLNVHGVGPKSAIGILSKTTMAEVQQAVLEDNPEVLTKMSGLGKKTAEKIILSLKNKVQNLIIKSGSEKDQASHKIDIEVFDALVELGYSTIEAKKALNQVDKAIIEPGERIKKALQILGGKG